MEILTTGRSRRRHRGGTVEEELAEARRLRDERAARRAAAREAQPEAPADEDSSDDEFYDSSADISGFRQVLDQAQADLQENPVAQPDPAPVQAEADESARQAVVDVAGTDSDDEPLTPVEQFFEDLRTRLEENPNTTPEQWWDAHVEAINQADVGDRVALATQLKDDLLEIKQDTDLSADTRRYFHELWSQMPAVIAELREEAEQQRRRPTGREALQQFIEIPRAPL